MININEVQKKKNDTEAELNAAVLVIKNKLSNKLEEFVDQQINTAIEQLSSTVTIQLENSAQLIKKEIDEYLALFNGTPLFSKQSLKEAIHNIDVLSTIANTAEKNGLSVKRYVNTQTHVTYSVEISW